MGQGKVQKSIMSVGHGMERMADIHFRSLPEIAFADARKGVIPYNFKRRLPQGDPYPRGRVLILPGIIYKFRVTRSYRGNSHNRS